MKSIVKYIIKVILYSQCLREYFILLNKHEKAIMPQFDDNLDKTAEIVYKMLKSLPKDLL